MDQSPPPLIEPPPPEPARPARWFIHLALLAAYPVVLGTVAFFAGREHEGPILPTNPWSLLGMAAAELVTFAVIFGIAWLVSGASANQLLLAWRGGWRPIGSGLVYSIGLRIALAIFALMVALIAGGLGLSGDDVQNTLQPDTEQLVDARALVEKPVYFLLNLTLISFVVAGLREELWRAGMLAALVALFPRQFDSAKGKVGAVAIVALLFGMGHLVQGWGGVAMTTLLGLGLGLIMVYHRSIWEAVLAHGFFDAGSFFLLYLLARFRPDLLPGG